MEKKERDMEIISAIKAEKTAIELKGEKISTPIRNRLIKKALAKEFGYKNISVRGDRGTAYGWVIIKIKSKKPYDCHCKPNIEPFHMCTSCDVKRLTIKERVWEIFKMTKLEKELGSCLQIIGEEEREPSSFLV